MLTARACLLLLLAVWTAHSQSCDSGSYFDGSQCSPCDSACAACMSQTICTVCKTQAFLTIVNGGLSCQWCSSLVPGCAICASQSSCSVCTQGFSLSGEVCQPSGGQVTISDTQISCQSYEVNINGACFPAIALCSHYNPDGSCCVCDNSTLLIQGYCIPAAIA
jgi:proprotein convertase subtilisin/kexin type 5